jgi:ectoine hydroxylase-related dioxygenase (phytanoyl-CoA dioxygenase family)
MNPGESAVFTLDQPDAIRAHFREHGYVAVRGILSVEECLATQEAMNTLMRAAEPRFDLDRPATYAHAPVKANYGVFGRGPLFAPQLLRNRQHPNVYRAFALLLDTPGLRVSHDRFAFYRPARTHPEWRTDYLYPGVHLDFNPAVYHRPDLVRSHREALTYHDEQDWVTENNCYCDEDGVQVQAVLNLEDNRTEDGGFQCVPGFHHRFEEWLAGLVSDDASPGGLYRFNAGPHDGRFVAKAVRVPVPAGALILWDQRLAHGTLANDSDRARLIQFLKMFPARIVSPERAEFREAALRAQFERAGFTEIGPEGRIVFGLG